MNVSGLRLFIFCHFGLLASGYADGLLQLIKDLQQGVKAQSIVYYDLIGACLVDDMVQQDVPSIVICEETDFELRKHYNSQLLAVVFIGTEFDDKVLSTLRMTLHRLDRTDVLFVTETLGREENWTWLFDWCWTHGFSNVLLSSSQQPALQLLALYRLHSQLIRPTTLSEYFNRRNEWRDFQGYQIRVLVGHDPPAGIVYKRSVVNQDPVISGDYYEIVKLFAVHHNASLVVILFPNNKSFSIFDCIEYFEAKQADFCTTFAASGERLKYVVAVVPAVTPSRAMVPVAKRLGTYQYYILPFDKSIWVALLLEVCCIAMATCFFYWRCVGSCDLSGSLLLAFKGMLHMGFSMEKLACKAKLLIFLIMFCSGLIFTNLYLAKVSSFMTAHVYEKEIDTLEDLEARGVDILVNPPIHQSINVLSLTKKLRRHTKLVEDHTYKSYLYDLSPKYGYLCPTDQCRFLMHQQKRMSRPNLRLMSEVITYLGISIPIAHESHFEEAFKEFVLRAFSAGLLEQISKRTTEEAIREGLLKTFRTEEENQVKPLTVEDLQVLWFILAIGYSAALFAFCVEKLVFYVTSKRSRVKINNLRNRLPE